jgi:hypothetical protein
MGAPEYLSAAALEKLRRLTPAPGGANVNLCSRRRRAGCRAAAAPSPPLPVSGTWPAVEAGRQPPAFQVSDTHAALGAAARRDVRPLGRRAPALRTQHRQCCPVEPHAPNRICGFPERAENLNLASDRGSIAQDGKQCAPRISGVASSLARAPSERRHSAVVPSHVIAR